MTSINKMACARSSCGGFQDQSFAFLDWKYINKSRIWKEKVQKNARFLFVDKWKLFVMKLSFEKFNLVFFTAESLACFSQSRQRGFWRNLRYILYSVVKKSSFLKGNFHGCFLHFDFGLKGKPQNLPDLKLILCCIMPCAQPMWLAWTYPQSS